MVFLNAVLYKHPHETQAAIKDAARSIMRILGQSGFSCEVCEVILDDLKNVIQRQYKEATFVFDVDKLPQKADRQCSKS